MTANFISIPEGLSVREAMKELVRQAAENDNISTVYVVDEAGILVGGIDLKDLIIARETTDLHSIVRTPYPYVRAFERILDCIERIRDCAEDSIPVLSSDGRIEGVLTAQDIVQLIDDETREDYAMLAGLTSEEDLCEPVKKSVYKRLPWLLVLLFLALIVSSVVGLFESVVAQLAIIVSFQSLILDMSGNVGTQSLAVTIRVLTDDRIDAAGKRHLIGKEVRVGLINGFLLGGASVLFVGLYLLLKGETALIAFSLSACTGLALLISMLLSSFSGTVIPLLLKRLRIDPAVASGPLITTVNDLIAVVTYYGLSWLLLIRILGVS